MAAQFITAIPAVVLGEQPVGAEGPLGQDGHRDVVWRTESPNLTNRLGQHSGYKLRPGHSALSPLP